MKLIKGQTFGGERPLFGIEDTRLEDVTIAEGESGIKCCRNVEADKCRFVGKYPWWHVDGSRITGCLFEPGSRSAIWYSRDMTMTDTVINAPKLFREMEHLTLENVTINDADETFWNITGLRGSCIAARYMSTDWIATRNMCSNTAATWKSTMPGL